MVYDAKNNLGFYLSLSPLSFDFSSPTKDIVFVPKTQQPRFAIWLLTGGYRTGAFLVFAWKALSSYISDKSSRSH